MANTVEGITASPETAKWVALAGFVGSIVSMGFVDGLNKKQRIMAVLSGMMMAHYLAPLIAYLFKEQDYQETIGFLVGLFGMSICSAIFRAIKASDIWSLIAKRFSGGGT